jgi:hypothetical protein
MVRELQAGDPWNSAIPAVKSRKFLFFGVLPKNFSTYYNVRGQTPGPLRTRLGTLSPPLCRWLRSDLSAFAFSLVGLVRCAGRSRLVRSIPAAFRILRAAVLRPEGAGTDQPGAECSAAPGSGANGPRSPEGAPQADASIVSPLQGFVAALIRYPGRRRRSHNSRRLALG